MTFFFLRDHCVPLKVFTVFRTFNGFNRSNYWPGQVHCSLHWLKSSANGAFQCTTNFSMMTACMECGQLRPWVATRYAWGSEVCQSIFDWQAWSRAECIHQFGMSPFHLNVKCTSQPAPKAQCPGAQFIERSSQFAFYLLIRFCSMSFKKCLMLYILYSFVLRWGSLRKVQVHKKYGVLLAIRFSTKAHVTEGKSPCALLMASRVGSCHDPFQ